MRRLIFSAPDKDGIETKYEAIASYEEDGKSFLLYTDKKINEKGNLNVFVSLYTEKDGDIFLQKIESKEDQIIANKFLRQIIEGIKEGK